MAAFAFIIASSIISLISANSFWICESGDPLVLGEYIADPDLKREQSPVFTNKNNLSLFRNSGLWYLGNLGPWPPETHYRCDDMILCGFGEETPRAPGKWSVAKRFGKSPAPVLSSTPCQAKADEL